MELVEQSELSELEHKVAEPEGKEEGAGRPGFRRGCR